MMKHHENINDLLIFKHYMEFEPIWYGECKIRKVEKER